MDEPLEDRSQPPTPEARAQYAHRAHGEAREAANRAVEMREWAHDAQLRAEGGRAGTSPVTKTSGKPAPPAPEAWVCARCGALVDTGREQCPACATNGWELAQVAWDTASIAQRQAQIDHGSAQATWEEARAAWQAARALWQQAEAAWATAERAWERAQANDEQAQVDWEAAQSAWRRARSERRTREAPGSHGKPEG